MGSDHHFYASLLGIYISQFAQQWQSVMGRAAYPFRTTQTVQGVDGALGQLSRLAAQADTLDADICSGAVDAKSATTKISNLNMLVEAQVTLIRSAVENLEQQDRRNLTKAATLDQPALKGLAAELASGADAMLNENLVQFVSRVSTGLATAEKDTSHDDPVDPDTTTDTALKTLSQATGTVPKSVLEKHWHLSGAPTAFWAT